MRTVALQLFLGCLLWCLLIAVMTSAAPELARYLEAEFPLFFTIGAGWGGQKNCPFHPPKPATCELALTLSKC